MARLLDAASPPWRERLASLERPLVVALPATLPAVRASESALRQIVAVLVDNAIVHGRGAVRVEALLLDGGVAIEVSDGGDGVGARGEQVFDRRGAGSVGSGIGLALARSLAEAEGGRLMLAGAARPSAFRRVLPLSG